MYYGVNAILENFALCFGARRGVCVYTARGPLVCDLSMEIAAANNDFVRHGPFVCDLKGAGRICFSV